MPSSLNKCEALVSEEEVSSSSNKNDSKRSTFFDVYGPQVLSLSSILFYFSSLFGYELVLGLIIIADRYIAFEY